MEEQPVQPILLRYGGAGKSCFEMTRRNLRKRLNPSCEGQKEKLFLKDSLFILEVGVY